MSLERFEASFLGLLLGWNLAEGIYLLDSNIFKAIMFLVLTLICVLLLSFRFKRISEGRAK